MKYCGKCGYQMQDYMVFCQKCGTEFMNANIPVSPLIEKVERLKQYNIMFDPNIITWQYLRAINNEDSTALLVESDKLCTEMEVLIKEILDDNTCEDAEIIEKEVYLFVLKSCINLCQSASIMLRNYSGYEELFNQGKMLVQNRLYDPHKFMEGMIEVDTLYLAFCGIQTSYASRIIKCIDADTIYFNNEYRSLTKQIGSSYNLMWKMYIKRHVDFFRSVTQSIIEMHWEIYNALIAGLSIRDIETLDESGWIDGLNDLEKNHDGGSYKKSFLEKMDESRKLKQEYEVMLMDEKYWEDHPNKLIQKREIDKQISDLVESKKAYITKKESLEADMQRIKSKDNELNSLLSDNEHKISSLKRRIFGKTKAEKAILELACENKRIQEKLSFTKEEMNNTEEPYKTLNIAIIDINNQIDNLNNRIKLLREDEPSVNVLELPE